MNKDTEGQTWEMMLLLNKKNHQFWLNIPDRDLKNFSKTSWSCILDGEGVNI